MAVVLLAAGLTGRVLAVSVDGRGRGGGALLVRLLLLLHRAALLLAAQSLVAVDRVVALVDGSGHAAAAALQWEKVYYSSSDFHRLVARPTTVSELCRPRDADMLGVISEFRPCWKCLGVTGNAGVL